MLQNLAFFKNRLVWNIPASMILGLVFGYFFNAAFLKSTILPLTILMIYPMMVTLNPRSVFSRCNYRLEAVTQSINFIFVPALAYFLGTIFFSNQPLTALGLFLIALLPTSGMTISWTGFAKGNVPVAIRMTIIGLVLGALATPVYVQLFMGEVVQVSLLKTFQQIGLVIFVPLLLGYLSQRYLVARNGPERFQKEIKPLFPSLSSLAVVAIIFVAMALKAKSVINNPASILVMIIPLALFYGINYGLTSLVGKTFFPRADGIALVYGSVMRNLSVALAVSLVAFGEAGVEIALIIAVAYIVQVQSAAWYVRLADRIFGSQPRTRPLPEVMPE